MLLLSSCVKEPLHPSPDANTLTLLLNVAGKDEPQTRGTGSTSDKTVADLTVWMFGDDGKCVYYQCIKAAGQPSADKAGWKLGVFTVKLKDVPELSTIKRMLVLANVDGKLAGGVPDANDQKGKSYDQLEAAITTLTSSSPTVLIATPLPMCYNGDYATTTIAATQSVVLTRSVARVVVDVVVDETNMPGLKGKLDLENAKVMVGNLTAQGSAYVHRNETDTPPVKATDCYKPGSTLADVVFYNTPFVALSHSNEKAFTPAPFYLNQRGAKTFEGNNADRYTTITLQVPYSQDGGTTWDSNNFYQVKVYNDDLVDAAAGRYHILPNRSYNVHLTVVGVGTDGIKVKIKCDPWTVVEKRLETGKSFALSNTEFVGYADPGSEMTVVSVAAFGKEEGTVTPGSTDVTVLTPTFPGYTPGIDIKVKMTGTTGSIILTQDGVPKTVNLTRKDRLLVWGEETKMVAASSADPYSTVKCVESTGFKIAKAKTNYNSAEEITPGKEIDDISNGFYLYTTHGFSPIVAPAVTKASVLITDNNKKTTRVYVEREAVTSTQLSHFYVGTFHRSGETGERLIRQQGTLYTGKWEAKVVVGSDWIVLDPSGVGDYPGNEDAEQHKLTTTETHIANGTGNIKFRLGLTGVNPQAGVNPRYGLVLVMHEQAGARKYHPIFVRQGEEDDYVFRPEDGYPTDVGLTNRPAAKKLTVYNLKKESNTDNPHPSNGHGKVSHPTKVGALFFANMQHSVMPGVPSYTMSGEQRDMKVNIGDPPGYNNPCPTGYSLLGENERFLLDYDRDILTKSIFRQSCFYSPIAKWDKCQNDNPLFEPAQLYADGYFDRRVLYKTAHADGYTTQDAIHNADFAASGTVLVNPATLQSVFMPGNGLLYYDGTHSYDGKDMRNVGTWMAWTGYGHNYNQFMFGIFYIGGGSYYYTGEQGGGFGKPEWRISNMVMYKSSVFSVRCVKT